MIHLPKRNTSSSFIFYIFAMTRFIEIHLIQNFAPSCLNRDDTGAPKDAMFGGYRRSRISSQCLKRAIRQTFSSAGLLTTEELGIRTRNIVSLLEEKLSEKGITESRTAIEQALSILELKLKEPKKKGKDEASKQPQTEYLLFLSNNAIAELADVIETHLNALTEGKSGRELKKAIEDCVSSASAVDVALFGRMLADRKELNVDAAAQVAHAISTHRVDRESDFFTAVDDWTRDDQADAGMLGTVEFNSSCQYRYAVVNLDQLQLNLGGDAVLAQRGLLAFLQASIHAIPTGKQNTFAAHNLPSFVGITVRSGQPVSLANAFEVPVKAGDHKRGLAAASVVKLQEHCQQLSKAYGLELNLSVMDLTDAWDGTRKEDLVGLLASIEDLVGSGS
ncbi:MAG: type I-E CRISPR-associated protein Cas7/Cse4/CasC [Cyanobacteriota bacterium]